MTEAGGQPFPLFAVLSPHLLPWEAGPGAVTAGRGWGTLSPASLQSYFSALVCPRVDLGSRTPSKVTLKGSSLQRSLPTTREEGCGGRKAGFCVEHGGQTGSWRWSPARTGETAAPGNLLGDSAFQANPDPESAFPGPEDTQAQITSGKEALGALRGTHA